MKGRRANETDALAAQLLEMQQQAMNYMIDAEALKQYYIQQQVTEVQSQQNPLDRPIKAASKYISEATITKMPVWEPPTLARVLEQNSFAHLTKTLSASYILPADMGAIHPGELSVRRRETPKKDQLIFELVQSVFQAQKFTIQQLKMQQQMFKSVDLIQTHYEHIPVYLLAYVDSFLPVPPFDIRPRLLMLLSLSFCYVDLHESVCAFFLTLRVCDFVESIFWLTHTVVFQGAYGRTTVAELLETHGIEKKAYRGAFTLPEHLDCVEKNLTVVDYLTNRCADDYAVIYRCWMGAKSHEKDIIYEYFPYFVANAVFRGFLRTFPQYQHVFSPKFLDTLYNNVIYMCSGILNYPDFQQQITQSIFGDSVIATAHAFAQYISGGSTLMGQENSDQINLEQAMFGIYLTSASRLTDNMKKTSEFYKSDESNQNQLDEGAITYGAVVKSIDFDFVLFDDLVGKSSKYSIYRAAIRNLQLEQKKSASTLIDYSLLFYSNQTIDQSVFDAMPSLSYGMNSESLRVMRHAIPFTTLSNISGPPRVRSPIQSIKKAQPVVRRKKSRTSVFDLDEVPEPQTKYTYLQTDEVAYYRRGKRKPTNFSEMVQQDIESFIVQESADDDGQKDLDLSYLSQMQHMANTVQQQTYSMTIDDNFIIRLPNKLRYHSPEETVVSQVIYNEIVTNNDVVLKMHDQEYQKIVDSALNGVSKLYSQRYQYKGTAKHTKAPIVSADSNYSETIEILRTHPLRVTNQTLSITSTSPLLIRYLKISNAPTPADFKNVIIQDEYRRDPNLGRSDFYGRKQARLNGYDTSGCGMAHTSIRQVNIVRRTRNDPWIAPSEYFGSDNDVQQRMSPNRFHIEYQQKKLELYKLRAQDRCDEKEALIELEVSKALFLDNNLKGRYARTAALSKAIVAEVDENAARNMNVSKGDKSQLFLHQMRDDLKRKMKNVDITEKIARYNQLMETRRKEKQMYSTQKK